MAQWKKDGRDFLTSSIRTNFSFPSAIKKCRSDSCF